LEGSLDRIMHFDVSLGDLGKRRHRTMRKYLFAMTPCLHFNNLSLISIHLTSA